MFVCLGRRAQLPLFTADCAGRGVADSIGPRRPPAVSGPLAAALGPPAARRAELQLGPSVRAARSEEGADRLRQED